MATMVRFGWFFVAILWQQGIPGSCFKPKCEEGSGCATSVRAPSLMQVMTSKSKIQDDLVDFEKAKEGEQPDLESGKGKDEQPDFESGSGKGKGYSYDYESGKGKGYSYYDYELPPMYFTERGAEELAKEPKVQEVFMAKGKPTPIAGTPVSIDLIDMLAAAYEMDHYELIAAGLQHGYLEIPGYGYGYDYEPGKGKGYDYGKGKGDYGKGKGGYDYGKGKGDGKGSGYFYHYDYYSHELPAGPFYVTQKGAEEMSNNRGVVGATRGATPAPGALLSQPLIDVLASVYGVDQGQIIEQGLAQGFITPSPMMPVAYDYHGNYDYDHHELPTGPFYVTEKGAEELSNNRGVVGATRGATPAPGALFSQPLIDVVASVYGVDQGELIEVALSKGFITPLPPTMPVAPGLACDCSCHQSKGAYVPDERNTPPNDCWLKDIGYDLPCC